MRSRTTAVQLVAIETDRVTEKDRAQVTATAVSRPNLIPNLTAEEVIDELFSPLQFMNTDTTTRPSPSDFVEAYPEHTTHGQQQFSAH